MFSVWVPVLVEGHRLAVVCCHAPGQAPPRCDAERLLGLLGLLVHDAALTVSEHLYRQQLRTLRVGTGNNALISYQAHALAGKGMRPTAFGIEVKHPALRRLLERVQRQYAEPLRLKELAAQVHLSPAYASDLFSKTIGVPFKQYLTNLRMERADGLLRAGMCSVKEVAGACGYGSSSPFRAAFRRWRGYAPNRVRRGGSSG